MELFDYKEFTNRNIGFVTEEEQDIIKSTQVFVCGVGGMGGACANSLIRMGVSNIAIADIDKFEVSNLNRQLFANLDTVNKSKVSSVIFLATKAIIGGGSSPCMRVPSQAKNFSELQIC